MPREGEEQRARARRYKDTGIDEACAVVESKGKAMSQATTFWRLAGMTYLEYASKATTVMRGALKEPARTAALARETVAYNRNVFVGGTPQGKLPVASLKEAGATSA